MKVSSSSVITSTAKVDSEIHQASMLCLALAQQLAQRGRSGRHAQAQEIERGQRQDRRAHAKRQERHDRRHAVGQDVPPHDPAVAHAQRPGRAHIVHLAVAQELGAHVVGQAHPAEQREQDQQQRDAGREHGAEDDQQVQLGHGAPDLDEALERQIGLAAEIALDRAREHADQRRRSPSAPAPNSTLSAKPVDQLRQQVAPAVVGAEQVVARGRGRDWAFCAK